MAIAVRGPRLWVIVVIAIGVAILLGAFLAVQSIFAQPQAPKQPIRFTHNFHVQAAGVDCAFCHRLASSSAEAGIPAIEQCMFCHQVAGLQNPEVQKVIAAYNEGRPIDWVAVHRVPDHVRFLHAPHIAANIDCSTCHGDVGSMAEVRQVRPLNMGDCVNCHRENNAPTDCWICHY